MTIPKEQQVDVVFVVQKTDRIESALADNAFEPYPGEIKSLTQLLRAAAAELISLRTANETIRKKYNIACEENERLQEKAEAMTKLEALGLGCDEISIEVFDDGAYVTLSTEVESPEDTARLGMKAMTSRDVFAEGDSLLAAIAAIPTPETSETPP